MQSTNVSSLTEPVRTDRELLADTWDDGQVASFTRLFQRQSAATTWGKFTHALLMPLRRYWARQQVAKVLEIAEATQLTGLASVKELRKAFDAKDGIHESTAQTAAIDMMLSGTIPDHRWDATLNDYLKAMQGWYQAIFADQSATLPLSRQALPTAAARGLRILIDFARQPDSAVSLTENKDVLAFVQHLHHDDYDKTVHPGPRYHEAFSKIYERYTDALACSDRVIETSDRVHATPTMQRERQESLDSAMAWLRNAPAFGAHPELVDTFIACVDAQDSKHPSDRLPAATRQLLARFLVGFTVAFQRDPQELVALCPSVIAVQDALLDRHDLKKALDLFPPGKAFNLLTSLNASGLSPSCVLALAEYLLVCDEILSMSKPPVSRPHRIKLNPESWIRLRYVFDQRDTWQRGLPAGDALQRTASSVISRLSEDINAFESALVARHPRKQSSVGNDDV